MENKIDYSTNITIHAMVQNKPDEWRLGQAYFNYAYALYPEETEHIRGTEYDCFYDDLKIPSFLEALNLQLSGNVNIEDVKRDLVSDNEKILSQTHEVKKDIVLRAIAKTLIEKNKRYGNSALSPLGVFYKGNATNSIAIRLDDKLSRIKNSTFPPRTNDVYDLLGYLFLYTISENYVDTENLEPDSKTSKFEAQVNYIKDLLFKCDEEPDNLLDCIRQIKAILNDIKETAPNVVNILSLMRLIVSYFILSDITDFSNLID